MLSSSRSPRGSWSGPTLRVLVILLASLNDDLLVLSSPVSSPATRHSQHTRITMPNAIMASRKFACVEPSPRAYNLKDLVESVGLLNPGESANQPIYIVVKRCDGHSGCCMATEKACTPVSSHTYYEDLEIEVLSVKSNQTRRRWITVEQHGKCSCELASYDQKVKLETLKPNVTIASSGEKKRG